MNIQKWNKEYDEHIVYKFLDDTTNDSSNSWRTKNC